MRGILLVAALQSAALAQGYWMQMANGPGRSADAMAYDSQRGRVVMFGGMVIPAFQGDTWEWDGNAWTQVAIPGPVPREHHAMAYDSVRGRTVVFGGSGGPDGYHGGPLGDTWEYDGVSWAQVATSGPPADEGSAMVFDTVRGVCLLLHGPTGGTWTWNGVVWQQVATAGPPARHYLCLAFDEARGRAVTFGGSPATADTWEWNGAAWAQVAVGGPPARYAAMLAYDARQAKTVLFGGSGATSGNDTWTWDGATWTQRTPAVSPPARAYGAMVYDRRHGHMVLFGGAGITPLMWDTWEWHDGTLSRAVSYGSGCGSPALALTPIAGSLPTLGAVAEVVLSAVPSTFAFVELGISRTAWAQGALPFPLDGYGLTGCNLLQSAEASFLLVPVAGGIGRFGKALPDQGWLLGLHLYVQAAAYAPGANAAQLIVSNGVDWTIGQS